MAKKLKSILRWLPALAVMSGIYYLSSTQGVSEVIPKGMLDSTYDHFISMMAHLGAYGLLALALEFGFGVNNRKTRLWIVLIVLLYGISDEYHQSFVPGRMAKISDVVYDVIGGVLATYRNNILGWLKGFIGKKD